MNQSISVKFTEKEEISPLSLSPMSPTPEEKDSSVSHKKLIPVDRMIISVAKLIDTKLSQRDKFFSLEICLNKKNDEFYRRFLSEISGICPRPLYYTTSWREEYSSEINPTYPPLEALNILPDNTLLHMLANNLKENEVRKILDDALVRGKTNIFVLRGDNCTGSGDFHHAIDLVKFVRNNYQNKFVICVAGFPQMHPESSSKEMDLTYLKEKVDAGANFIISQIFLESKVFVNFVEDCRRFGINVPIIPGIFTITNVESLMRLAKSCNFEIPQNVLKDIEPLKDNDEDVYEYGIELATRMITEIFQSQSAHGFHLYTLNRASIVLDVCKKIFID